MKTKHHKFLSIMLMMAAAVGMISGLSAAAYADSIQYQEASYSESAGVTYTTKTASNATALTYRTTNWSNGGWYYVSGTLTISDRITVSGTANLILCDGAELNATSGITTTSATLNIYAQTEGTGTLTAQGTNGGAGIGGNQGNAGGTLNIHGGNVSATGSAFEDDDNAEEYIGAGIGGGDVGGGGIITIYGGTVIAMGGTLNENGGAGIGCGAFGGGGTITIYGGTVTATGGNDAQGIGCGTQQRNSSTLLGNPGTLTVGSGLVVYGGDTENPTNIIQPPYNNSDRKRYMKVAPSSLPAVSYVEMTFDAATSQVTSAEKSTSNYTLVSPDILTWSNDAWYVVSGSVQVSSRITVSGDIHLILRDGAVLSADSGITVADGHTLNIYAQTGGTGKLYAVGSANTAAIGSGGTLTIHGGHVEAIGSNTAAIACTSVDVYSGYVVADGGSNASGITGTITVSSILRVFGGSSTSAINVLTDYTSNRPQYMRVAAPHTSHSLSNYQLSDDGTTITAVCANSDGLCGFPNATATLTILTPETAGGAAILSGDAEAFGVSSSNITYAQKSGSDWGTESSTVPTGSGFFKASITVNGTTAYVTYGVSAITVASGITHGTVTAPTVAAVGVVVPLTISPATGYELDTLTPTKTGDGTAIDVTTNADGSKSFVMPDEEVTVNATFKMTDYTISFGVTSGSVTVPETANYQETVRLIISPDAGYGVQSITITDGVTLNLVSKDTDTGVEIYEFSMPAGNINFDLTFAATTIYTIFYKASSTTTSVLYRFSSGDVGFKMKSDAKIDDTVCWGGQMRGVVNKNSFPISFSVNSGNWTEINCAVVTDLSSSFSSLAEGNAILISGDASAFVASFKWGYYDTDDNGNLQLRSDYGTKYYFVTSGTTSVSVPNPTRRGYTFAGWSYKDKDDADKTIDASGGDTTTVSIKDNIDKTTVFGAIWQHIISTVTYDLNGGSWSNSSTASVAYGNTATQPTDPTRNAYAFSGWTVKSRTRAIKGSQEVTLAAGSNFDFSTTKITEDITLQAAWKHVHSYAYIPFSKLNDVIPGALSQERIDKYGPYLHFKLCSLADDYCFEAHKYDKNGKCICGAEKPSTTVTLEETYGDLGMVVTSNPKKNSEVTLSAPSIGTDQFLKWEYRSLNGTTWHDFASTPVVGFIIPGSMRVHAVYQSLTSPNLTLTAERYGDDGLMFMMQYVLPKGWKATNAAVLYGDNHMVRYMQVVRSHTPVATLELSDPFLGIPIPGTQIDVGTWDESTYYYDREDNLLSVDGNKGPLRVHMINGTAVNIPGYNEVVGKKADNLGQTSGYACGGLTGIKGENNGNHYIYVLGFVEYTDADNAKHLTAVGPIAVTYNSASSTITDTETYTYNY